MTQDPTATPAGCDAALELLRTQGWCVIDRGPVAVLGEDGNRRSLQSAGVACAAAILFGSVAARSSAPSALTISS